MAPATSCPSPHATTMTSASLVELARESKLAVDWDRILVLRSDDKSASQWKWIENARNFSIYTKQERARGGDPVGSGSSFSVLSVGDVKASVNEISSLLFARSQGEYETKMDALYGKDFKSGEYLYNVKCGPSAYANSPTDELVPSQLSVRTAMFSNGKWFGNDEEVCVLDAIYHDHSSRSFEKLLTVLRPQEVVSEDRFASSKFAKYREMIGGYRIEPMAIRSQQEAVDTTKAQACPLQNPLNKKQQHVSRVHFYATVSSPICLSDLSSLSVSSSSSSSSAKTETPVSKSLRQYIVHLAKECHRLSLLIRRRRLGVQTLVSKKRFLPPTNKPCFVCARKLLVAKVCRVCGHGVCKDCSDKYERERRSRSRKSKVTIESIRVCDPCLERVENADYSSITDESLFGPAVVPEADADAASAEAELGYLLRDALAHSSTPKHKRSVMNVIKCVLDEEGSFLDDSIHSTSASTPQSVSLTDFHLENIPHDQASHRSTENRSYQLDTRDPDTIIEAPVCEDEDKRLRAVAEVDIENLADSVELNILCELAARELGCKTSTISILDRDNLNCVASNVNALHKVKMPRDNTVCAHTILEPTANIVPHPEADIRYADSSIVKDHGAKFYFGFPIMGDNDQIIGSFCVVNDETMEVTESKYTAFKKLSEACNKVVRIHSERRRKNSSLSSSTNTSQ